jgi:hypothetical protein
MPDCGRIPQVILLRAAPICVWLPVALFGRQSEDTPVVLRSETRAVRSMSWSRTKHGERIRDLRKEDFTVFDDG